MKLLKHPTAWLPIVMSLASLTMLLVLIALHNPQATPQPDEGAAAHVFQLLQTVQIPIGIFFAVRYLPKRPRPALTVLGLQAVTWIAAVFPVWYLGL